MHLSIACAQGPRERRSGSQSHEILVAHELVRYTDGLGRPCAAANCQGSSPTVHGKTPVAQRAALSRLWRSLRQCGHAGIAAELYAG